MQRDTKVRHILFYNNTAKDCQSGRTQPNMSAEKPRCTVGATFVNAMVMVKIAF